MSGKNGHVEWADEQGRLFRIIPLDLGDPDPSHGLVIGPPLEISEMELGEERSVRFHNELYHRGILTESDARRNPAEVEAALKATLRIDIGRVMEAYRGNGD